jgi:hypothetical protein
MPRPGFHDNGRDTYYVSRTGVIYRAYSDHSVDFPRRVGALPSRCTHADDAIGEYEKACMLDMIRDAFGPDAT